MKYKKDEVISFMRNRDEFGGLSNMHGAYPITVNGVKFRTSEALYQAMKHPHNPKLQQKIIDEASPITAKQIARSSECRKDWDNIRIPVMHWCLEAKLVCNIETFGELLKKTGKKDIVEISYRDKFWGATPEGDYLVGFNFLGKTLKIVRNRYLISESYSYYKLSPLKMPNFYLLDQPIRTIRRS